ncbi:MAG: hypothetical protein RID93_15185, partial [Sandaracinaceae bacterium]
MTGLRVLVLTGDRDAWADVARELAERRHNLVFDDPGDEPVAVLVADGPNGERWAQAASRRAAHPDALLVAVIDPGKPEEVVTALESGASHCLPRPVRPSALIVLLERAARKPQPPPPPPGGQVGFHGMVG